MTDDFPLRPRPETSPLPTKAGRDDQPRDYCLFGFEDDHIDALVVALTDRGVAYRSFVLAVRRTLEGMMDAAEEASTPSRAAAAAERRRRAQSTNDGILENLENAVEDRS